MVITRPYIEPRRIISLRKRMTDRELLLKYVMSRDEEAFLELLRRLGPMVYAICRRTLCNATEADDAFQATFLVLAHRANSIQGSISPWIYGVAMRVAKKARIKAVRQRLREMKAAKPEFRMDSQPDLELRLILDEELEKLPEKLRQVIIVCDVEGISRSRAARELGWPEGTVAKRLSKAREVLAVQLTRRGITLSVSGLAASLACVAQAHVPTSLMQQTVAEALGFAAGHVLQSVVSHGLALGVIQAMKYSAVKLGLVALVLVTFSTGMLFAQKIGRGFKSGTPNQMTMPLFSIKQQVDDEALKKEWSIRLSQLEKDDWRGAFSLGLELAKLKPALGYEILKENWPTLDISTKQQLTKAFYYQLPYPLHARNHEKLIRIFDLSMRDTNPEVSEYMLPYISELAFFDFKKDPNAYREWYKHHGDKKPLEVILPRINDLAATLVESIDVRFQEQFACLTSSQYVFRDIAEARKVAMESGLIQKLESWITPSSEKPDSKTQRRIEASLRLVGFMQPDENYVRRVVLPLIQAHHPKGIRTAALDVLQGKQNGWAQSELMSIIRDELNSPSKDYTALVSKAGYVLASHEKPEVIPFLIGILAADHRAEMQYWIGQMGLCPLTKVAPSKLQDAAWWRKWWSENKVGYSQEVQNLEIPTFNAVHQLDAEDLLHADQDDELVDVPSESLKIDDDDQKRYLLIKHNSAKQPEEGFGLFVVLPGGDGSADFNPFIRRMAKYAFGEKYVVAQPIAPKWDDQQFEKIVWPTDSSKYPAAKFTTDEFLLNVVKDVGTKLKINPKKVFVLGWSSGGLPCYSVMTRKDTPFTGAFIAMSVFRNNPNLANVKGKGIFLLQSPQDKVTAYRFAEQAEKALKQAGAKCKLQSYDGGHGWHGPVWDHVKKGKDWLEKETGK